MNNSTLYGHKRRPPEKKIKYHGFVAPRITCESSWIDVPHRNLKHVWTLRSGSVCDSRMIIELCKERRLFLCRLLYWLSRSMQRGLTLKVREILVYDTERDEVIDP